MAGSMLSWMRVRLRRGGRRGGAKYLRINAADDNEALGDAHLVTRLRDTTVTSHQPCLRDD